MPRTPFFAVVLVLSVAQSTSKADAVSPVLCPANAKLATLLAGSDLVLVGKMDVSKQRLLDEARKPSPEYLAIPIGIENVIKGGSVGSAIVRFYPQDAAYKPSNDAVIGLAGASAILFLTRVDEGPVGLYFAGYTPDALQKATELTVAAARAEALRQAQINALWRADPTLPHYEKVRALVARLGRVSGDEQQKVFSRLEALGNEAVPAIIAHLDDERPLQTRAISLVNHSTNAFEEMRHYGPERVVDGLDAVLNQITGASFGSIVNGGSARQRQATVAGWRIYAADLACRKGK